MNVKLAFLFLARFARLTLLQVNAQLATVCQTTLKHFVFKLNNYDGILYVLKIELTHLYLASHEVDNGKQCGPRSDAAERGV